MFTGFVIIKCESVVRLIKSKRRNPVRSVFAFIDTEAQS